MKTTLIDAFAHSKHCHLYELSKITSVFLHKLVACTYIAVRPRSNLEVTFVTVCPTSQGELK